ncbi:MAG TPA: phosphoserine phosphatase [Polyangiaceae bacterium]|nr:phosphoserine phosphatase [Polyangiaceae bacterium]
MKVRAEHLSLPKQGETANGDGVFFRTDAAGALFGVIDGLGHGPGAEEVTRMAKSYLTGATLDTSLAALMEALHGALHGTRGAAATICLLRGTQLEACAVGNVELRSGDLRFPLVYSAGILGVNVRTFRVCSAKLNRPARFVAFSDGISTRASTDDVRQLTPADACHFIMRRYRRDNDDATVLVADLE